MKKFLKSIAQHLPASRKRVEKAVLESRLNERKAFNEKLEKASSNTIKERERMEKTIFLLLKEQDASIEGLRKAIESNLETQKEFLVEKEGVFKEVLQDQNEKLVSLKEQFKAVWAQVNPPAYTEGHTQYGWRVIHAGIGEGKEGLEWVYIVTKGDGDNKSTKEVTEITKDL